MRKTKEITITAEGRDRNKRFLVTEMPASQAEKWAARAFFAIGKAGFQIPDQLQDLGMAGLAVVGIGMLAKVDWKDAEPLMDEMMGCVQRVEEHLTRPLLEDDIEEVATRGLLRSEVFELHTGFSLAAALSTGLSSLAQGAAAGITETISTSRS